MKILVTGATGGLGLALVEKLRSENHEIIALGRDENRGALLKGLGAEFIAQDIVKIDDFAPFLTGVDIIIHAAALSSPWGKSEDFIAINFDTTRNLYEAAKATKTKAFIFISSPSIYSGPFERLNIDENSKIHESNLNHYAYTKLMAERYLANNKSEVSTIILRPRAIIGPNDTVLLPRFLRLIGRGKFPLFNGGEALIELTDVRDVANAINLCVKNYSKLNDESFNISGGKSMKLRDLITMLAGAMNRNVKFTHINFKIAAPLIKILEFVCERLPNSPEPILTHYGLCALSFSQTFDLARAQKILGFLPQYDAFNSAKEIAISMGQKHDN